MIKGSRMSGKTTVIAFDLITRKNVDFAELKSSSNVLAYNTKIFMSVLNGERKELTNDEFLTLKGLIIL